MMTAQIVYVLMSYDVDGTNAEFHGVVADEKVAMEWAAVDPKHRSALDWELGEIAD